MKKGWQYWAKWIAGLVAAVAAAVAGYMASGCATSTPVVVQNQTYRCETAVEGEGNSITFRDCVRSNGDQSGDTEADQETDAAIPIEVKPPETSCLRPSRRWAWN
jgi:hypothetical protein